MIDSKRLRLVLRVTLGLAFLLFLLIAAKGLSGLNSKGNELTQLKLKDRAVQAQLSSLAIAKKEVETYAYFKDVAKTVIPEDKDQAQAVLDITRLASQAGINIGSITFPNSSLGGSAPSAGGGQSAANPAAQPGATNAQSASSKAAISQAKPVAGIPNVYSLELTITPESGVQVPENRKVTYPKLLDFLKKLENNRRTAQITQVNIQPEGDETNLNPYIDFSLIINVFIKP